MAVLTPVTGCICFVAGCLLAANIESSAASRSEGTDSPVWRWPLTPGPERPIEETADHGSTKSPRARGDRRRLAKSRPSFVPGIEILVHKPREPQTLLNPVKIHVFSEQQTKHSKRSHRSWKHSDNNENLISASSSLMDFNENPWKNVERTKSHKRKPHDLQNNGSSSNSERLNHQPNQNEMPERKRKGEKKQKNKRRKEKGSEKRRRRRRKLRVPVKALFYEDRPGSVEERRDNLLRRGVSSVRQPISEPRLITLHSPTRVYVPVWKKGSTNDSAVGNGGCVRCPSNTTLTADKGKTSAILPVPSLSICRSLARRKGRLNLAVISGPRPGTPLVEGHYPTELIAWKIGGHVFSCQYAVTVKVKRCPEMKLGRRVSVTCEDSNVWGSFCKFSCSSTDFVLTGVDSATCIESEEEGMIWSSPPPTCDKKIQTYPAIAIPKQSVACKVPSLPPNGTFVCDSVSRNGFYSSDTICQFFCYPGYRLSLKSTDSLFLCKNGAWAPKVEVTCVAEHCSSLEPPINGTIDCTSTQSTSLNNGVFPNGTVCTYKCDTGFVIPKSQEMLSKVHCLVTDWNQTSVPECKQQVPPTAENCTDQTLFAAGSAVWKSKQPRFFSEAADGGRREIQNVSCSHSSKKLAVGKYINLCKAYDSELDVFGYCNYTVTVREKTCPTPPEKIPNAKVKCHHRKKPVKGSSYVPGTLCEVSCNQGYVLSKPFRRKSSAYVFCLRNFKWNRYIWPKCQKTYRPAFRQDDCKSKEITLSGDKTTTRIDLPRLENPRRGTVEVKCSLEGDLSVGNYTNSCEAKDLDTGLSATCSYAIRVKSSSCPVLEAVEFGLLFCTAGQGTKSTCRYECIEGYAIPSSQESLAARECLPNGQWNATALPSCVPATLPIPDNSSCVNVSIETDDLSNVTLQLPNFIAANGTILTANCTPNAVDSYGTTTVSCSAYDSELRISGNCNFTVNLTAPEEDEGTPTIAEPGCLDQTVSVENITTGIDYPRFLTIRNTEAEVNCTNVSAIADDSPQIVTCVAVDPETRSSASCQFNVTVLKVEGDSATTTQQSPELDSATTTQQSPELDSATTTQQSPELDSATTTQQSPELDSATTTQQSPEGVTEEPQTATQGESSVTESEISSPAVTDVSTGNETADTNGTDDEEISPTVQPSTQESVKTTVSSLDDIPVPVGEGCVDQSTEPGFIMNITYPEFVTVRGTPAEVLCSRLDPDIHEPQTVSCEATDPETKASTSCMFQVTIVEEKLTSHDVMETISEAMVPDIYSTLSQAEPPYPEEPGCFNQDVAADPSSVIYPSFITYRGTPAEVSCSLVEEVFNVTQVVKCDAVDPETNASASCEFEVTLLQVDSSSDVFEDVTEHIKGDMDCPPIEAPENGHIRCPEPDVCMVECNDGFGFSDSYFIIQQGLIRCNRSTGMWDFQNKFDDTPSCLRVRPPSSVAVWLGFSAYVENCTSLQEGLEDRIKQKLVDLNDETCRVIDCNATVALNCSEEDGENSTLIATWNIEAPYNPDDFEHSGKVPVAESQLDSVLDTTHKSVSEKSNFSEDLQSMGLQLIQKSYRRGHMLLFCNQKGFTYNKRRDRCIECSEGTFEVGGTCEPCPPQHYQDKTGQTECIPCPTNGMSMKASGC